MAVKLVTTIGKTKYKSFFQTCKQCNQNLETEQYVFTCNTPRKQRYYCIPCARKTNFTNTSIWWNRLTKYKRYDTLLNSDLVLDQEEKEQISQLSYDKQTEDVKMMLDIYYYREKK